MSADYYPRDVGAIPVLLERDREQPGRYIGRTVWGKLVFPSKGTIFSEEIRWVALESEGETSIAGRGLTDRQHDELLERGDARLTAYLRITPCEECGNKLTVGRVEHLVRLGYLRPVCKKCQEVLNEKYQYLRETRPADERRPGR